MGDLLAGVGLEREHECVVRESREQERALRAEADRAWWAASSPRDRLRELSIYSLSRMTEPERGRWWMRVEMSAPALGDEAERARVAFGRRVSDDD